MKKINYTLNGNGTIKGYVVEGCVKFDASLPWIECDLSQILLNHSKVIDDRLVNDFNLKTKLQELYGIRN
jgi:hypothetical protein